MIDFRQLASFGVQQVDRMVLHSNPPSWDWQATIPGYYNLWICLSGNGQMNVNGSTFNFAPGLGILFFPGDVVYAYKKNDTLMNNIGLHFTINDAAEKMGVFTRFRGIPAHLRSLSLLHEMSRYLARIPVSAAEEANQWSAQIFLVFAREWELGPDDPRDRVIRDQIERIKEKPYGSVSISRLAHQANLSLSQYRRRFKRLAGHQPNAFFLQQRIQSARTLLVESTLNIDQIAQALGYRDTPFFSRQFKAKTGLTPSQFRNATRPSEALTFY